MHSDIQERAGIRFRESGPKEGAPCFLLVHGLGGSLHQWVEIQRQTKDMWRTIAVDIPGFGERARNQWSFTFEWAANQIARFCEAMDIQDATIVSHSIGSAVGGRLAAKLPDRFPRVVFVSGSLFRAASVTQNPFLTFRYPSLGWAVGAQFLSGIMPVPGLVRNLLRRSAVARQLVMWPFVASPMKLDGALVAEALTGNGSWAVLRVLLTARTIDYPGIMRSVTQPVGLIWGNKDRLTSPADLRQMQAAVRVIHQHEVSGCGHWPMVEAPAVLIDFLRKWERDGE